jgi:menaquinone-dependent protoporphyrinogen oxidase
VTVAKDKDGVTGGWLAVGLRPTRLPIQPGLYIRVSLLGADRLFFGDSLTNVLVAYSSKTHSTAEIAEAIADELRLEGLEAEAHSVDEVRDLDDYDAVVLGSALYIFRWRRNAVAFARRHAEALRARPVWLFSSGPFDRSAEEGEIPPVKGARRVFERIGARGHRTFGGRAVAPQFKDRLEREGKETDFRNFTQIRLWARSIAVELCAPLATTAPPGAAPAGA